VLCRHALAALCAAPIAWLQCPCSLLSLHCTPLGGLSPVRLALLLSAPECCSHLWLLHKALHLAILVDDHNTCDQHSAAQHSEPNMKTSAHSAVHLWRARLTQQPMA
jgi:hypothetical protein